MDPSDPVVVVGAGPVGVTAAIELARRGVSVRVVSAGAGPSTTSKAMGIHARTLEVLQRTGVSDRLVGLGLPLHSFRIHDQRRAIAELPFAEVPSAFPFALSLGQDVTEKVLRDRLQEAGVEVEWGTRLVQLEQEDGTVRLTLEQGERRHEARASWVIGCDGGSSTVRRSSGIAFEGEPFPQWFLVADLQVDSPVTAGEAGRSRTNMFFSDEGATAVFPLPEPGLYRLATALPQDAVPAIDDDESRGGGGDRGAPTVDLAALEQLWQRRVGRPARLSDPRWISPFQFNSRIAASYRSGRVFLAGDAAHVHSPVGGQGMNTGIQDAVNLTWKLAAVLEGAPEGLLDTYEAERRPVAEDVLHDSRRNAVMASATSPLAKAGRSLALRTVTRVGPVRRRFLAGLTMLAVSYPASVLPGRPAPTGSRPRWAPGPGHRAPDGDVSLRGCPARLLGLLAPHGHALVSFDAGRADHDNSLADLLPEIRTGHDLVSEIHVVVVRRYRGHGKNEQSGLSPEEITEVLDPTGRLHDTYGASRPVMVLVRPDGVIGWRGPLAPSGLPLLRAVTDASLPPARDSHAHPRRLPT